MTGKISVITVVWNDAEHIRRTLDSFLSQTYEDKELIVIDGGSTDGTAEIVRQYAPHLAFWCSEKDGGIYDAMNKGVSHASGAWINILNSGDTYVSPTSLSEAMEAAQSDCDIIYGNSIQETDGNIQSIYAGTDPRRMEWKPIYRHGSSLVRTEVQRKYGFDLSKTPRYGFALDWDMIYRAYKGGCRFQYVNKFIQAYSLDGVSNDIAKSLKYNYRITSSDRFSLAKYLFFQKTRLSHSFKHSSFYNWLRAFFVEYVVNDGLPHLPFWRLRRFYLRKMGLQIGAKSFIMKHCYFMSPNRMKVGSYTHINRGCLLDARGGITIGDNVSISHDVRILTGSHDYRSASFRAHYLPIVIDDYAWLGVGSTVLCGVHIGRGAVVAAGAVVTHDVPPYTIVGGVPARKIGERPKDLNYHCIWDVPFT